MMLRTASTARETGAFLLSDKCVRELEAVPIAAFGQQGRTTEHVNGERVYPRAFA